MQRNGFIYYLQQKCVKCKKRTNPIFYLEMKSQTLKNIITKSKIRTQDFHVLQKREFLWKKKLFCYKLNDIDESFQKCPICYLNLLNFGNNNNNME